MSQSDIFFRALQEYRKFTDNSECERQRKSIKTANPRSDRIEVVKNDCQIEDDWIEAIEKGLVHIEKALAEERQFIRSNGEVIPIEKVRQVSRESVEHLARHSDLLTKQNEGENLIPDKLYTVERLTDYAVYENRFLYMLLCYLRDFVTYRYEKICELTNTYSGSLHIKKDIVHGGRKTAVEIKLTDRIRNDEYLKRNNPVKDKIARIDLILKTVALFLSTPLMEDVSKSPMLKPPITETNVLKMNKNFKGAKELYYFLAAYDRDGFTVQKKTKTFSPFSEITAEEFSESIALLSFLTYEHGLEIRDELAADYEKKLKAEEKEREQKLKEKIAKLKKRVAETGKGADEYMLLLEQRIKSLEDDALALLSAKAEIEKLNSDIEGLNENISSLNEEIANRLDEEARLKAEHAEEVGKLQSEHEAALTQLESRHAEEVDSLNAAHSEQVENLNSAHAEEIENINASNRQQTERMEEAARRKEQEFATIITATQAQISAARADCEKAAAETEKIRREKLLCEAMLNGLKKQYGLPTGDFISEMKFDELEKQYQALKALFKEQWKKAKKSIRREVLKGGQPVTNQPQAMQPPQIIPTPPTNAVGENTQTNQTPDGDKKQ